MHTHNLYHIHLISPWTFIKNKNCCASFSNSHSLCFDAVVKHCYLILWCYAVCLICRMHKKWPHEKKKMKKNWISFIYLFIYLFGKGLMPFFVHHTAMQWPLPRSFLDKFLGEKEMGKAFFLIRCIMKGIAWIMNIVGWEGLSGSAQSFTWDW